MEKLPNVYYASFNLRLKAMLLDQAFILMVFFLNLFIISSFQDLPSFARIFIFSSIFLLEPFFVSIAGGTIGHLITGIRVVDSISLKNINFFRSIVRTLSKTCFGFLSFILMLYSKKYQALHDVLAHSMVIVKSNRVAEKHRIEAQQWKNFLEEKKLKEQQASLLRRTITILFWITISFIFLMVIFFFSVPYECISKDVCSKRDTNILELISTFWIF